MIVGLISSKLDKGMILTLYIQQSVIDNNKDYVKRNPDYRIFRAPVGSKLKEGVRYCSVDGDADRLVYYFLREGNFFLLDGDRIACLIATYLQKRLGKVKT